MEVESMHIYVKVKSNRMAHISSFSNYQFLANYLFT